MTKVNNGGMLPVRSWVLKRLAAIIPLLIVAAVGITVAPSPAGAEPPPTPASCDDAPLAGVIPLRDGSAPAPPAVSARAVAVVDAESGRVLYEVRGHERLSPASTTKIMTAILALEAVPGDTAVVSTTDASRMIGSSVMGLRPGVPITVRDLLYGLMLPSGNDAALEIARAVSGDRAAFVALMNAKASELGLVDTQFMNPHGLDARGHYSSAYDLSMLTRYAMANEEFRRIVGARSYYLGLPSDYSINNGNSLLNTYPGAEGVKIGWTDRAGWTLVASAVRDGRRVFVTVLDSQDRDADAAALFDWAFASHRWNAIGPQTQLALQLMRRFGMGGALVRSLAGCGPEVVG